MDESISQSPADLSALRDLVRWRYPGWASMGACRRYPTDLFFSESDERITQAKLVCQHLCPVRWTCLGFYINEPYGVFGGTDPRQRRHLRKQEFPDPSYLRNYVEAFCDADFLDDGPDCEELPLVFSLSENDRAR